MAREEDEGALTQLRAYLAREDLGPQGRLPPERRLARHLGIGRTALRKALARLEDEGLIWRHVGRGTFLGSRPLPTGRNLSEVIHRTNPAEVMEARLLLEPELARLAALKARPADLEAMRECIARSKAAREWRSYEVWDNRLHRTIAQATGNTTLIALFDNLNTVRRAVAWGRLRNYALTPDLSHHSFAEHDRILAAIAERDPQGAASHMRQHLASVRAKLLAALEDTGTAAPPGAEMPAPAASNRAP